MYDAYAAARGVAVRQARRYLQNGPRSVVSAIPQRATHDVLPVRRVLLHGLLAGMMRAICVGSLRSC